jgi:3-methyl-2-oxobutanoate hydroxymethyltransferase
MQPRVTTSTLMKMKEEKKKITALTAYDFPFARMLDQAWWSREKTIPFR